MFKPSDTMLARVLKNWVAKHKPPENGREQLLSKAASTPIKKYNLSVFVPNPKFIEYPTYSANEWSQNPHSLFFAQSIHAGIQARV